MESELDSGGNKEPVTFRVETIRLDFFVLYCAFHIREEKEQEDQSGWWWSGPNWQQDR